MALAAGIALAAPQAGADRSREMSNVAANLLAQVTVARQAIAHQDLAAAQSAVRQASSFGDQIRAMAPSADPLIVPISTQSDTVSTIVPAHKHSGRLKKNAEVSDVSGSYSATTLNLTLARQELQDARGALDAGRMSDADRDLASVESAAKTETYSGELPLMEVRQNLTIARTRVEAGDYKNSILPLKSAARALDRFVRQDPRPRHADRAETMRIEMDAYAEGIRKDHADALSRINGWLDQVRDWVNSGAAR